MNWPMHRFIKSISQNDIDNALDGSCEHIAIGQPGHLVGENDSFGPMVRYLECNDCYKETKRLEEEEEVFCTDCGCTVKVKDTISWKPYDFYAPQGDEPLIICNSCKVKETHLERVAYDKQNREAECGYLGDD